MGIKGINEAKRKIKELKKKSREAMQRGILKTAKLIEADAKSAVPVKNGLLKSSIGTEQTPETTYVFAGAKYAPYQEFGTGPLTQAPKGYEAYAAEFIVTGEGHGKPRPFLFPAFFRHEKSAEKNIEKELQQVVDELNR